MASLVLALVTTATPATAQVRRRFDPENLQLEEAGVLHADLFFGAVQGESVGRWLMPDFDLNLGLTSGVVLGIDGAWAVEGTDKHLLAFDHRAPDNLWFSTKLGLWQNVNEARHRAWAIGAQLGPRVATAPDAHGAGFQGLALFGQTVNGIHIVANLGGIVDPGAGVSRGRPVAVLSGVDVSSSLGGRDRWTFTFDLSGVFFVSSGKNQLVTTFGPTWAATPWLDVGVSGLFSVLEGGDRYGGYVSLAPKVTLWGDAAPGTTGRP